VHQLLGTASVPSSPIFVTLMMEALHSSEMSLLTRATWHNIPEDGVLQVSEGLQTSPSITVHSYQNSNVLKRKLFIKYNHSITTTEHARPTSFLQATCQILFFL
jgi:hypothetical protein